MGLAAPSPDRAVANGNRWATNASQRAHEDLKALFSSKKNNFETRALNVLLAQILEDHVWM